MIYKAKETYKKLKDDENYHAFGSPSKHCRLLEGQGVEINIVPEELKKHLRAIKKKDNNG